MKLHCLLGRHDVAEGVTYNGGYYFGRCDGCERDLIRFGYRAWRTVPRGHRVVWKAGTGEHAIQPDFGPNLPVLGLERPVPSPTSPRMIPEYRPDGPDGDDDAKIRLGESPEAGSDQSAAYSLAILAALALQALLRFSVPADHASAGAGAEAA